LIALAGAALALAANSAMAAGDAAAGKTVFARCGICHSSAKGAPNKIGPNLWGVAGRKAGTYPGFNYSSAMKNSGITWSDEKLEAYIQHPQQVVPDNKMPFAGLSDLKQTKDLVAYLDTLK
jgi:cytochrome c